MSLRSQPSAERAGAGLGGYGARSAWELPSATKGDLRNPLWTPNLFTLFVLGIVGLLGMWKLLKGAVRGVGSGACGKQF